MPRKYIPKTPEQKAEGRARQMRAHHHNSYLGFVTMGQRQMMTVLHADTTTEEAKDTASSILALLGELHEQLKTRVDY